MSHYCNPTFPLIRIGTVMAFACTGTILFAASPETATTSGATSSSLFSWRPFLGPFHSLVLHYPIGFLTMALILEAYGCLRESSNSPAIKRLTLHLSLWTGLVSAALGWMRAGTGGYDPATVDAHRIYGMAVPFATIASILALRWSSRKEGLPFPRMVYRVCLLITLGLLVVAGHLGGNLTHGSSYLVQNAPPFLKTMLGEKQVAQDAGPTGLNPAQALYRDVLKPAFEQKCQSCHGPEKQKGKYRIDQPSMLVKGGDSDKAAVVPGDPMQSHLLRLVLLPPDHDDAMPPDGKTPLTAEEVLALARWIQAGAPFPPTN